jgi:WD40 repeat protein
MDSIQLQRAEEYFAEDRRADALPRWALVLRNNPSNHLAAERLMSTLSHRKWARLACPPMEHSNRVTCALFSRDGTKVVTSSADNTANVWDARTGRRLAGPFTHSAEINTAMPSEDGRFVVTASKDKTARVWNALTGVSVTEPLQHSGDVSMAGFTPDGEQVLTISGDRAQLWSVGKGQPIGKVLKGANYALDVRLSPDGSRFAMACVGGHVQVWDAASHHLLHHFRHTDNANHVAFSPDGAQLATASSDKTARIWNVQSGQPVSDPLRHDSPVGTVEFSPDGQRVVTSSRDHTAQIWDARTGQRIGQPLKHDGVVRSAVFSPEGLRVLTSSWDKTVRVWDALTGKPLTEPIIHESKVFFAQFHPDGERVLTASNGKDVIIWQVVGTPALGIHFPTDVGSVEFSPDGKKIVVASDGANTRVWDPWSGRPLTPPLGSAANRHVNYAVFSPDGRRVATGSEDGTARIWNATDGQPVTKPLVHEGQVYYAEFNPTGTRLLTSSPQKSVVWEAESKGGQLAIPHQDVWNSARFSPDGQKLVTVTESGIGRVWDSRTGEPVTPPMVHAARVTSARFSPDGRFVLTAAKEPSFFIWDANTGRRVGTSYPHRESVQHAFYSPNGKYVLTSTGSYGAQLWDLQSGSSVAGEFGARDNINNAIFVPDGSRVMVAYADGRLQLWDPFSSQRLSELLPHSQGIRWNRCSADGRLIAVSSNDRKVTLWETPPAALPVPSWLPELAEGLAGQRFNPQGMLEPVRSADLWTAQQKMAAWANAQSPERGSPDPQQVGTTERAGHSSIAPLRVQRAAAGDSRAPANAFYARWAKWFLADSSSRTVLPSSPLTLPEYAVQLSEQRTFESASEALRLWPTNGYIMAILAGACIGRTEQTNGYAEWLTQRATELAPGQPVSWWSRAIFLIGLKRPAEAVEMMAQVEPLTPNNPKFYNDQGAMMVQADQWENAIAAFTKSIGLTCIPTNGLRQLRRDAFHARRMALDHLGRNSEAYHDLLCGGWIPPRATNTINELIDLTRFYNESFVERAIERGLSGPLLFQHTLAGSAFDLRGIVQLDGSEEQADDGNFPEKVIGIPITQSVRFLHFLHATKGTMPDGVRVGHYAIHYADGEERAVPIIYGEHLRSFTVSIDNARQLKVASEVWTHPDQDPLHNIRLSKHTWANPRPTVEITTVDFVSAKTRCAPFLVAITAEP